MIGIALVAGLFTRVAALASLAPLFTFRLHGARGGAGTAAAHPAV